MLKKKGIQRTFIIILIILLIILLFWFCFANCYEIQPKYRDHKDTSEVDKKNQKDKDNQDESVIKKDDSEMKDNSSDQNGSNVGNSGSAGNNGQNTSNSGNKGNVSGGSSAGNGSSNNGSNGSNSGNSGSSGNNQGGGTVPVPRPTIATVSRGTGETSNVTVSQNGTNIVVRGQMAAKAPLPNQGIYTGYYVQFHFLAPATYTAAELANSYVSSPYSGAVYHNFIDGYTNGKPYFHYTQEFTTGRTIQLKVNWGIGEVTYTIRFEVTDENGNNI